MAKGKMEYTKPKKKDKNLRPRVPLAVLTPADTGYALEQSYDAWSQEDVKLVYENIAKNRPIEKDWIGALIHLLALSANDKLNTSEDGIKQALIDYFDDNDDGPKEPQPGTVRWMRNRIMSEIERVEKAHVYGDE